MGDFFDKATQKKNLSLRLYRKSLRSGKLLATLGVSILAISPLSWAGFALNSFLSYDDLATKVVRLQSMVLTNEYFADFDSSRSFACEGQEATPEENRLRADLAPSRSALRQFHLNQFSFIPQPVLLTLLTIEVLEVPVTDYCQLLYASIPVRLDALR